MPALPLDEGPVFPPGFFDGLNDSYGRAPAEPRGVTGFLRDQALNLGAGTLGLARGVEGAIEATAPWMDVDLSDPELGRVREMQRGWRDTLSSGADALTQSMSPQGQREVSAKFLPGAGHTIWDSDVSLPGALIGKVTRSTPSVVASILGTVFGGPAVGYVTAGSLTAGDVYNDIREGIEKMPSDELAEKNPLYAGYLTMMPEEQARERLLAEVGSNRALLMGTITAATSKYLGIEGRVASRMGGGAVGGRVGGIVGEAVQEGTEQIAQNVLTHTGRSAAGHDAPFDWHSLANETIESMVVGGLMGGALGGGKHAPAGVNDRPIDVDHEAALTGTPLEITVSPSGVTPEPRVVTPEAAPTGPEVVLDQKRAVAGQEMDALDKTTKDAGANAGVVQHVDTQPTAPAAPVGVGVDEAAALHDYLETPGDPNAGIEDNIEPSDTAPPIPPVPDVPVVTPQVQQAITAPVQAAVQPAEPRLEPQPGQETGVPAPAQLETERAATPALEPTPAVEPAPVVPTGRIIEGGQAVKDKSGQLKSPTAKNAPRMGKLKKAQIEAGVAPEKVLTAKELRAKTRQDELAGLAERVRAAQAKLPEPDASKGAPAARAYARELAQLAEIGGVKLGNLAADADPALRLIKEAVQIGKGQGTASRAIEFAGSDVSVRKGEAVGSRYVGGASFNEDIGESEGTKGGAVRNEAEEEVTEEIDAKRAAARRAELEKAEAAAQAAARAEAEKKTAAAMQNLVAGEAKRPVMVERKRVVTPPGKRENLFERRRREAEEKEREAAAEVERTRKRRETDREKGIAEMVALMQERDQALAGITDFADATIPVRDIADKIAAVMRRLEVQLASKSEPARAHRSAVEQWKKLQDQAAGNATATTPAAAVAQLREQRLEENRDILPRRPEDEAAARELDAVMGPRSDTRGTLGEILKAKDILFTDEYKGVHRVLMQEMAGRIRKLARDVPVRVVDDRTFAEEWAARVPDDVGEMPQGFYDPNTDEIVARSSQLDTPLLIHEGLHAAYMHALDARQDVKDHVRTLMSAVARQLIKEHVSQPNAPATMKMPYGMTDEHEFISEAFSNRAFQELLMRTPADPTAGAQARGFKRALISVWDAIIRSVKQAVFKDGGPSIGILEQVIRATQQLDTTATRHVEGAPLLASRESGQTINVKEALAAMSQNVADRGPGVESWWRRTGLKLGTWDQITRNMKHLFDTARGEGNPLDRVLDAIKSQAVFAQNKAKEGQVWAQKHKELIKTHGAEVMDRASSVAINATMANVNLGPNADNSHLGKNDARYFQNKAQLAQLQTQFAALPQEVQDYLLDSSKYYRDTQNEMVKTLVSNFLQAHNPTLSIQAYAQLTHNIMNGKLGPDDAAILDDNGLFRALQNATGLQVIKGIYFPLMRHGDFVVRTQQSMGEMFGGKVVEKDKKGNVVVEWAAPKDKDARAAFKQFAESTGAKITSVGKTRYLPDGTEVSEEEAKGRTHTVAYRARVQVMGVQFFDTNAKAEKFIREQGPSYEWHDPTALDRVEQDRSGALTNQAFQNIMSSLDRREDLDPAFKGILKNALREASIRTMVGNRIQARSMARRNVAGASEDMARNTIQYATAASNYLGKLRYMPKVREALADMRQLLTDQPKDKDFHQRSQVLNEAVKRIDQNVMNVEDPPQLVKDVMALSFMDKLFSPMYSVINGMQPWMVTLPVMSGHYGALRSAAAIGRAYNSVGAGGLAWSGLKDTATATRNITAIGLDTTDLVGSMKRHIAKETDGVFLNKLIDELQRTGQLSPEAGLELAAAISSGVGPIRMGIAKVERIARQLPQAVEAINRATTAVAAARLGRSVGMTEEQAIAHAKDMVDQTQGDYATYNQPSVFKHPLARAPLQFKKYAQLMSALVVDMTRKSFKGATKRERQVAQRQLMALFSVQMAMAGTMGLPGLEIAKAAFMIASMLGFGDGWDDIERKLRKTLDAAIGKTPSELITKGVLARGIAQFVPGFPDLSSRVSLADMWLWGEPKSTDRQGAQAYLFNLVGGAPAGLMLDWVEAVQHAGRGEFQDAFIKAVPNKFVADTAKAVKQYGVGDITEAEAFTQMMGARSARMAEKGVKTGDEIAVGKKLEEERSRLQREYIGAGSQGELLKIKARVLAHNARAKELNKPRQTIGTAGLDKIRANKDQERRALRGG